MTETRSQVQLLKDNVGKYILGKSETIELAVVTLLAGGHLLIEDVPGIGKTTLAYALARSINCSFSRIQFTSDLLPSDILGVSIFDAKKQEFVFRHGPIFTNVVLADEINRTTPKTQSCLLEAMNERQVSVDSATYRLPRPFMVVATQNPIEYHGTHPLPESELDRFLMRIRIGYPDETAEKQIVRQQLLTLPKNKIEPVLSSEDVTRMQDAISNVQVEDGVLDYVMTLVEATRRHPALILGASPRGALYLYRSAQALAFVQDRDYVIPDDVKRLAVPVLAHRLVGESAVRAAPGELDQYDSIVQEIIDSTSVPL